LLFDKFSRITRKGIKKAEKSGLEMKDINNKPELDSFYGLYVKKMRDFGTPQHSYDFFDNFLKNFRDNLKGLNCYKDGKLISSLIVFYSKDYMYAAYNFSESQFLVYQPNDLLHWEVIKWAIKRGIKFFDIGQCDANAEEGTHAAGIYRFKSKWGAELYDKSYFYLDLSEKSNKIGEESGSGYKKAIGIWKKIPLPIVKKIGPIIASQLAL
jgi:lipid II:glycine glycyltransferase (peptidoglycan interpeptide bridge formation enzyme)